MTSIHRKPCKLDMNRIIWEADNTEAYVDSFIAFDNSPDTETDLITELGYIPHEDQPSSLFTN